MSHAEPMATERRVAAYERQNGRGHSFTPKQQRRMAKKGLQAVLRSMTEGGAA